MSSRLIPEITDVCYVETVAEVRSVMGLKATALTNGEVKPMSWFKNDDGKTTKAVLGERTTKSAVAHLILAAILILTGVIAGWWVGSQTESYLGALIILAGLLLAIPFAGDPYIDSNDNDRWGGWVEFGMKAIGLVGVILIVIVGVSIVKTLMNTRTDLGNQTTAVGQKEQTINRWKLFSATKAPPAADNQLPFPDDLYKQVRWNKEGQLLLPRYVDGTKWALRLPDKIVELSAGERHGYKVEEDVENLVVSGSFPGDAKIYFVNSAMVPSVSRPLPTK